jgi:hypothetical protein
MEIEDLVELSQQEIKRVGDHFPMFFIEQEDGNIELLAAEISKDSDKDLVRETLSKYVNASNVSRYFSVTTGWMVQQKDGLDLTIAPSEHPDRFEVLMVCEYKKSGTQIAAYRINRDDGGKVQSFEPVHSGDGTMLTKYVFFNIWTQHEIDLRGCDTEDV